MMLSLDIDWWSVLFNSLFVALCAFAGYTLRAAPVFGVLVPALALAMVAGIGVYRHAARRYGAPALALLPGEELLLRVSAQTAPPPGRVFRLRTYGLLFVTTRRAIFLGPELSAAVRLESIVTIDEHSGFLGKLSWVSLRTRDQALTMEVRSPKRLKEFLSAQVDRVQKRQ